MKRLLKTGLAVVSVLAMMLSMLCALPFSASAEEVVPRALLRQNLSQWKNYYYGGGNLYDTGCGMFSIVNAVGYLTGNEMSITEVAQWGHDIGGYNPGSNSDGTYRMTIYPRLQAKYGEQYGFTVDCGSTNEGYWAGSGSTTLKNHLAGGGVAIGHVPGHFIAIVGYNSSTNKFHVYDSYPTTARGTGSGDAWVTQSHLATGKLKLDWFCLLSGTGYPVNLDYGEDPSSTADRLGTYKVTTPVDDPLNVRAGAGTSYDVLDTTVNGDIINVTELSGNWGKFVTVNKKVEGWASVKNYAEYIGIDALAYTTAPGFGTLTKTVDSKGRTTLVNNTAETAAYDFKLPLQVGTSTTPYFCISISKNSGNGYYFGLTQAGSGFWMMRDCMSGDQLVNETSAPFMTGDEKLEIDVNTWWTGKTADYRIDSVRVYVAANSSITLNYMYFAAGSGIVTDESYNLLSGDLNVPEVEVVPTSNENLLNPDAITFGDDTKSGSYHYDNGKLTVTSNETEFYDIVLDINWEYTPEATPLLLFDVESDVRFDIILTSTTSVGDWDFGLVADFGPGLAESIGKTLDDSYLPAGTYSAKTVDIHSCYTYNNILPEDGISTIKQVIIRVGGTGTVTVNALQVSDSNTVVTYADGITKSDSSPKATPPSPVLVGDVNEDGVVTTADARMILMYTAGDTLTDTQLTAADYNGDGTVSTTDARQLLVDIVG